MTAVLRAIRARGIRRVVATALAATVTVMILTVAAQPYRDATGHPTPNQAEMTSGSGQVVVGSINTSVVDASRSTNLGAVFLLVLATLLAVAVAVDPDALRRRRTPPPPPPLPAGPRRGVLAPRAPPLLSLV